MCVRVCICIRMLACPSPKVLITFCLYGLDQGGVHAFNELGRVYSYKDRGYEPAEAQRAIAYTDMSWYDAIREHG